MTIEKGVGGQFNTSSILLNESLNGFKSEQVVSGWANTKYQEMMGHYKGMPIGKTISFRSMGIPTADTGRIATLTAIETDFETVSIDTTKMVNKAFNYGSVEIETDRDEMTDTTSYRTGVAISVKNELGLVNEMKSQTHYIIDRTGQDGISWDDIASVNTLSHKLNLSGKKMSFLNTDNYDSLQRSARTDNIFDNSSQNADINKEFYLGKYAGYEIMRAESLTSPEGTHIAGTEGGNTLTVKVAVVASASYNTGVVSLEGAVPLTGTLVDGDVLSFTNLASTQLLSHHYRAPIGFELQVIVRGNYTADGAGAIDNVNVVTGFIPLDLTPGAGNFFSNINSLPQMGDAVVVMPSRRMSYFVPKGTLNCAYIPLKDISTIPDVLKNKLTGPNGEMPMNRRSKKNIFMRLGLDSDILQDDIRMRFDIQPVYKQFLRSTIAIATAL